MRGRQLTLKYTRDGHESARPWLEKAIALDREFADPVASLASIPVIAHVNKWGENWQNGLQTGIELAAKAVALDDLSPHAHFALGVTYFWSGKHEECIAEQEQAIALDPNLAMAHQVSGNALHYMGDSAAAEERLETAQRLNPNGDSVMHQLALCYFMQGNLEAAVDMLRRRIALTPSTDASRALLASTFGHMGRVEEANVAWAELMEVHPEYSFADRRKFLPYRKEQDPERIAEGLRKAGIET